MRKHRSADNLFDDDGHRKIYRSVLKVQLSLGKFDEASSHGVTKTSDVSSTSDSHSHWSPRSVKQHYVGTTMHVAVSSSILESRSCHMNNPPSYVSSQTRLHFSMNQSKNGDYPKHTYNGQEGTHGASRMLSSLSSVDASKDVVHCETKVSKINVVLSKGSEESMSENQPPIKPRIIRTVSGPICVRHSSNREERDSSDSSHSAKVSQTHSKYSKSFMRHEFSAADKNVPSGHKAKSVKYYLSPHSARISSEGHRHVDRHHHHHHQQQQHSTTSNQTPGHHHVSPCHTSRPHSPVTSSSNISSHSPSRHSVSPTHHSVHSSNTSRHHSPNSCKPSHHLSAGHVADHANYQSSLTIEIKSQSQSDTNLSVESYQDPLKSDTMDMDISGGQSNFQRQLSVPTDMTVLTAAGDVAEVQKTSPYKYNLDRWLQSVLKVNELDPGDSYCVSHRTGNEWTARGQSQLRETFSALGLSRDGSNILGVDCAYNQSDIHIHSSPDSAPNFHSATYCEDTKQFVPDISSQTEFGPKPPRDYRQFLSDTSDASSVWKDPQVAIYITDDASDSMFSDSFFTPRSSIHDDMSVRHPSRSPRGSFGSIFSTRSSNADSAVDIHNPEDEPMEVTVSDVCSSTPRTVTDHNRDSKIFDSSDYSRNTLSLPPFVITDHSSPNSSPVQYGCSEIDRSLLSSSESPDTSLSDFSLEDSDVEMQSPSKSKQSSWKKIRGIIKWSPFVQVFKKNKYPWIQLAGHQGNFQAGESGSVLKKLDKKEKQCYIKLMHDNLRPLVPEYKGDVEKNGEKYLQLQDLLCDFQVPCVMDIKMGCRSFLEDELEKAMFKPTLRKDMYQKMIEVEPGAPTDEENGQKAVTKPRYMQWRDDISSSVNLGFRVEGVKKSDGTSSKDFKKAKTEDQVREILKSFMADNMSVISMYVERLKEIRRVQETSEFFQRHEIIGSSLLFVHDSNNACAWMIDFGKTVPLPEHVQTNHRDCWKEGNHEDGYLFGMDKLIAILESLLSVP